MAGWTPPEDAEMARLRARVAELEARLRECADDLEAELKARHLQADGKPHPALAHDFERDMAPVRNARALLGEKPA